MTQASEPVERYRDPLRFVDASSLAQLRKRARTKALRQVLGGGGLIMLGFMLTPIDQGSAPWRPSGSLTAVLFIFGAYFAVRGIRRFFNLKEYMIRLSRDDLIRQYPHLKTLEEKFYNKPPVRPLSLQKMVLLGFVIACCTALLVVAIVLSQD